MKFNLSFLFIGISVLGLGACSGGGSSSCVPGSGVNVTVSGNITFDRVPLADSGALDFPATTVEPARKIRVEAVCNSVLSSTTTDENGNYSLSVPSGTSGLLVRAKAQMLQSGNPGWDVRILDEQQAVELVFALDSSPFNVDSTVLTRNLHAPSGSDGSSYTSARRAAPFAILDTVYKSMQLVMDVNPNAVFPPLKIKWSANSSEGSFYSDRTKTITILGWLNDTDEYDEHVVAHEWGHYFQDAFSRDDSIGGPHSGSDILDIRVAFSEGFGNAFSAMVLGDPLYRDSQGLTAGFSMDIERNSCTNNGWYNECSVQSVLYDFYDTDNDGGNDIFDLGFDEIHQVLVDADKLRDSEAFTSLFSFINAFKRLPTMDGLETAVDNLLNEQSISVSIIDDYGADASVAGGSDIPLPPYLLGTDVFAGTEVCSSRVHGGYNGLGVSRYVRFTVPSNTNYTFEAQRVDGLNPADPDMYLYHKGQLLAVGESWNENSESFSVYLQTGRDYILELREYAYTDPDLAPTSPTATTETCFTLTRTP